MPSLSFREADVLTLLDPAAAAIVRRLGPGAPWDLVGETLAGSGPPAAAAGRRVWNSVLTEFTDFVCSDSARYADLRAQWDELCSRSAAIAVTALTATFAAQLGLGATVVAPLVVWLVLSAMRIGTRTFCEVRGGAATRGRTFP